MRNSLIRFISLGAAGLAAAMLISGCFAIEVTPKSLSWTEGESKEAEGKPKKVVIKNVANELYTFEIKPESNTNKALFKKVENTCTNGKIVKKGEECIAKIAIDQELPYEKTSGAFIVEGEVIAGKATGEKGKLEVKLKTT
jgi:hypothetical protein